MWGLRVFGGARENSSLLMDVLIFGIWLGFFYTAGSTLGYAIVTFALAIREQISFKKQTRYALLAACLAYAFWPTGVLRWLENRLQAMGILGSGADVQKLVFVWIIPGIVSGFLVWMGVRTINRLFTHLKPQTSQGT